MTDRPIPLAEWLRAAYPEDGGCPPPGAYLPAELAARSPASRRALEEHAAGCAACAAERDLACAFEPTAGDLAAARSDVDFVRGRLEAAAPFSGLASPAGAVPTPQTRLLRWRQRERARRPALWMTLAAAALAAVVGVATQWTRSNRPPELATLGAEDLVRGASVRALAPRGEVAEAPVELIWEPVAGAADYRLRLSDVRERVLWETAAPSSPVPLPAAVRGALDRAVVYHWEVEARDAGGGRMAASGPVNFQIRPEAE